MKRTTSALAILAALTLASGPAYADCEDGERCDPPPAPWYISNATQPDSDLDDGRTFDDVTDPEPLFDNGREGPGDQDGDQERDHGGSSGDWSGTLDDGRG